MEKIRLLFADDHNLVRIGIKGLLNQTEDIIVIGEAENGDEVINKYQKYHPDIILSDINMLQKSGIDAAIEILKIDPDAKILFLSMYFDENYIYKIFSIGGKGLISKDTIIDELALAIRKVYVGDYYFSGINNEELKEIVDKHEKLFIDNKMINENFSEREKRVMKEIALGNSSEQIAEIIGIGKRSIDAYRSSIMNKMKFNTSAQLMAYSVKNYGEEK
ncbi:hypothetical protein APF79_14305 [bacterium BRH_c32]|nr:MAG: hypothetical protein APF79_14305 [bacterium BRH_c32]